jgi:hypothetical protein
MFDLQLKDSEGSPCHLRRVSFPVVVDGASFNEVTHHAIGVIV